MPTKYNCLKLTTDVLPSQKLHHALSRHTPVITMETALQEWQMKAQNVTASKGGKEQTVQLVS